jgi:cell division protein FtsQ
MIVLIFVALIFLSVGLLFRVSRIEVEGNHRIGTDQIRAASHIELGKNLFLVNRFAVYRDIFAEFPYVKDVQVQTKIPKTIVITITESDPACLLEYAGYYWTIDENGRVLENKPAFGALDIPLVVGLAPLAPALGQKAVFSTEDGDKEFALYAVLNALLTEGIIMDSQRIDVSKSYSLSFIYQDRLTVQLGFPSDLDYKLSYIKPALKQLKSEQKATLDVSSAIDNSVFLIPDNE